jgi:ABC-type oligopeptide transport system ATPase subunit
MTSQPILQVDSLFKHFPVARSIRDRLLRNPNKVVHAVDGVNFTVQRGEILALVGESGSGKTTVGMNVLGLQMPTKGKILFDDYNVADWARGKLQPMSNSTGDIGSLSRRQQILSLRRRAQMIFHDILFMRLSTNHW